VAGFWCLNIYITDLQVQFGQLVVWSIFSSAVWADASAVLHFNFDLRGLRINRHSHCFPIKPLRKEYWVYFIRCFCFKIASVLHNCGFLLLVVKQWFPKKPEGIKISWEWKEIAQFFSTILQLSHHFHSIFSSTFRCFCENLQTTNTAGKALLSNYWKIVPKFCNCIHF